MPARSRLPPDSPIAPPPTPLPATFDLEDPLQIQLVLEGGAMGGRREAVHDGVSRTSGR
jgi:hypothetical protein